MEGTESDLFLQVGDSVEPIGDPGSKHSSSVAGAGGRIQALCFSCSALRLFLFPCIVGTAQEPKLQTCGMGPVKHNKKMAMAQRINIYGLGLFVKAAFVALSFQPVLPCRTSTASAVRAAILIWSSIQEGLEDTGH